MGWSSFKSNDALNGFFSEDGVAETRGDVRELLVVSPFNLVLVTLVVIVDTRSRSFTKSLLVVVVLGLRVPGAGGLSPSMVELEVDVVQMGVGGLTVSDLIVLRRNVALFLEVIGANLCDMHVNQVGVRAVDLHELVFVVTVQIDVVVVADVLVAKDVLGFAVLVAWGIHVPQLHVAGLLLLIDLKEEVLLGDDLLVGGLSELFFRNLAFEFD